VGLRHRAPAGNVHCTIRKLPAHKLRERYLGVTATDWSQSTLLYSRYGNGIATNNLSKMLAGLIVPERPIGNMYFAAWSHNVISNAVNLCNDLKMGEYRKLSLSRESLVATSLADQIQQQSRSHRGSCSSPKFTAPFWAASSTTASWCPS
jgi:hypothetical protein